MKKKRFDHLGWHRTLTDEQHIYILPEGILVDYIAGLVSHPLWVPTCAGQQVKILDSHYRWIHFAPTGAHHALTVQLDPHDCPVQFYLDINQSNERDEDGIPYGLDLYLDIVAVPDGWQVKAAEIMDGDELEEALKEGHITQTQADFAWTQAQRLHVQLLSQQFADLKLVQEHLAEHSRPLHV
ncbi:DUF402 domain-containing protein [Deinococcus roseus]|uniref:DUF402 domain-containing protein n=1 Tax=Deinococcus roseus TaxID=392414 RepID=A0ABQ2D192_9DEIO|nr:DUF402 domain-containing protein [Deinococcus roseus]GGJ40951.1 hypothetical protein GCM10008938_28740 [Deinococcus roseus]